MFNEILRVELFYNLRNRRSNLTKCENKEAIINYKYTPKHIKCHFTPLRYTLISLRLMYGVQWLLLCRRCHGED